MTTTLLWIAGVVAVGCALYGLHRLALWLESKGQLYYLNKKSETGAATAFVALQQVLDPPAKHVLHVKEQKRSHSEEDGGQGAE